MEKKLQTAIDLIRNDGIVAFPTETVYGLGGSAYSDIACERIFALKGRPSHNPLIIHVPSVEQAMDIADFSQDAVRLTSLWPGPISFVLPIAKYRRSISRHVTAGLDTIAVRIPSHPLALKLINSCGVPIAAPSANKSGQLSTTTADDVRSNFANEIMVLESREPIRYGLESTIVDLSGEHPVILRHGFYTAHDLESVLAKPVLVSEDTSDIKAPGMLLRHYSPRAKLRLNATSIEKHEVAINFGDRILSADYCLNLSRRGDLLEAATNLYRYLHIADDYAMRHDLSIAVVPIPHHAIGVAINDRLSRGANI